MPNTPKLILKDPKKSLSKDFGSLGHRGRLLREIRRPGQDGVGCAAHKPIKVI